MTKNTSNNTKELPNGWEWKKLGEVVKVMSGYSFNSEDFTDYNSVKSVKITNVGVNNFVEENDNLLPEGFEIKYKDFLVSTGDIVVALTRPIISTGFKISFVPVEYDNALLNQRVACLKSKKESSLRFIYNYLSTNNVYDYVEDKSRTLNQPNLSVKDLKDILIPLPPLKEQERIVQKLDTAFQNLDEAITLQKENIAHTQELKKAVLVEQISNLACEMKKLGEVVIFNPSKSEVKDLDDCEVSFVPMADMNERKMYFETKQTKLLSEVYKGYTYFREDDILLAKVTPCFENGKSGIARNLTNKIGFGSSEYFVFRAKQVVIPQFIYYIISSNDFLEIGANNVSGAVGLKRVTKDFIENYKIPIPPLPEQEKIVAYLDTSFAKLDALIMEQEARLAQLMELKKSVLQEAFEGKL